jgi:hypothetical protein
MRASEDRLVVTVASSFSVAVDRSSPSAAAGAVFKRGGESARAIIDRFARS